MSEHEPDPGKSRKDPVAEPVKTEGTPSGESRREQSVAPDEAALFGAGPGPRYFGEGDYASGGTNNEGNYESWDTNPHGSSGSFNDADGFGGTRLLGEEAPLGGVPAKPRKPEDPQKPG